MDKPTGIPRVILAKLWKSLEENGMWKMKLSNAACHVHSSFLISRA
jgi:hypothetical protein